MFLPKIVEAYLHKKCQICCKKNFKPFLFNLHTLSKFLTGQLMNFKYCQLNCFECVQSIFADNTGCSNASLYVLNSSCDLDFEF